MPVTTLHPEYQSMSGKWKRCRDAAAGQDAVHQAGETYLPKLKEQAPADYTAYKTRTPFFNASYRTISGLVGMLFRKQEEMEIPAAIKAYLDDVTMTGEPLHVFAQQIAMEVLTVGRVGVLVDYPQTDPSLSMTMARAAQIGLRPSLQRFSAETIINWKVGRVNNATVLTMIVLEEDATLQGDPYEHKTEKHYRVLDLVQIDGAWAYRVRVFRLNDKKQEEQVGEDVFPRMNGRFIPYIPFLIFGVDALRPQVDVPPLIDLVDLNLAHYRVCADYEHGCHFTGLPTAVVSGYTPANPDDKLYIGSTSAWVFTDPSATASFLEFTGQGLGALERNLDRKEAQMAAIGARLLQNDPRVNETATTAAIRHGGETSILSAIAQCLSLGIERALVIFAEWAGATGKVTYDINRDFFPMPMDPQMLQALVSAWQQGGISQETLFQNLQRGEVVSPNTTFEQEQAKIESEPDKMGTPMQFGRMPSLVTSVSEDDAA